jgi:hypothetical protein
VQVMAKLPFVTACHEAAHCVAVLLCGEWVYSVTASTVPQIVIDRRGREIGPVFGLVESSLNPATPEVVSALLAQDETQRPALMRTAINSVFVDGAGAIAEARAGRRGFGEVVLFANGVRGDYQMALDALAPLMADPAEQRRCVHEVWRLARPIIGRGKPWEAVLSLARALQESGGRLEGESIEQVVSAIIGPMPKQDWARPVVTPQAWPPA